MTEFNDPAQVNPQPGKPSRAPLSQDDPLVVASACISAFYKASLTAGTTSGLDWCEFLSRQLSQIVQTITKHEVSDIKEAPGLLMDSRFFNRSILGQFVYIADHLAKAVVEARDVGNSGQRGNSLHSGVWPLADQFGCAAETMAPMLLGLCVEIQEELARATGNLSPFAEMLNAPYSRVRKQAVNSVGKLREVDPETAFAFLSGALKSQTQKAVIEVVLVELKAFGAAAVEPMLEFLRTQNMLKNYDLMRLAIGSLESTAGAQKATWYLKRLAQEHSHAGVRSDAGDALKQIQKKGG